MSDWSADAASAGVRPVSSRCRPDASASARRWTVSRSAASDDTSALSRPSRSVSEAISASRALHRRANGTTPYATASATALTRAPIATVRRSRALGPRRTDPEGDGEGFIGRVALAEPRAGREEADALEARVLVEQGNDGRRVARRAV